MEAFLRGFLPRVLPAGHGFEVHPFRGKGDLLRQLQGRLEGYANWLPADWRIVVLVDRDDDDCVVLKDELERKAARAGLRTRATSAASWQVVNRVVIEELEAWYFADWDAVYSAFPKVSPTLGKKPRYRDPDAIRGGTWETFERILQECGYFKAGLRKVEVARTMGAIVATNGNRSRSFTKFYEAIAEATA